MDKKSFVKGAGILAISGIIVKIIGAVFRIPLMNIIGSEGIGLYQMAYPIYAFYWWPPLRVCRSHIQDGLGGTGHRQPLRRLQDL